LQAHQSQESTEESAEEST
jgi:hypothetical protein